MMKKNVLAIDVGGTNVKFLLSGKRTPIKFPSGHELTPVQMVRGVLAMLGDWTFDVVSVGFPGPVEKGRPKDEPRHLGGGWTRFDFEKALGKPTKVINDAAMQALGSYDGGRMLFLGLGTGLGSALITEEAIVDLELAHLPYKRKKSFEEYVGLAGLEKLGRKKWQKAVHDVTERLRAAMVADYVVLGGGNAKRLTELPEHARLGDNANAFLGGFRLWQDNPLGAK